ncbi:MAG: rod shape-determining protein MreD [Desulfuromonadales bacterium]|nr:rod shape-determining protein MreD [Desulfuromonadales bacterium]
MSHFASALLFAGTAIVLQAGFLPSLLPGYAKPDLLLILVVYLGLHERPWRGGALVYGIGWGYDCFAGHFPGLHGFVLLALFLAVRAIVTRVNTESSVLLLALVLTGTVLQGVLVAFALDFFHRTQQVWSLILLQLPWQVILNLLSAYILLHVTLWLQRTFLPRSTLPGLRKLDSRYDS